MKILTIDDELVSREKMKKIMGSFGQCESVENGYDGLELFKAALSAKEPFDLITIDVSMPDMDGTEVLHSMREIEEEFSVPKDARARTIMVTSHSDKDTIITCVQAGCDDYIVKPFDKTVISQKLYRYGLCDNIESDDQPSIRKFVMQTVTSFRDGKIELPVLSHVVNDILEEMKKPDSGIEVMAGLIEQDAVISMKLLATANSPAYRGAEKVHSVVNAIPRLGLKETQNIVTAIASKSLFKTKDKNCEELMGKLWMHSVACAYCTRSIAGVIRYPDREKLFMMGLLHDIGKVLLLKTIGSNTGEGIVFDRSEVIESLQEVHASFGAALLSEWGFDRDFQQVASHHDWATFKPDTLKELLIVNLANILARQMGYSIFEDDIVDVTGIDSACHLDIDDEEIKDIIEETKSLLKQSAASMF